MLGRFTVFLGCSNTKQQIFNRVIETSLFEFLRNIFQAYNAFTFSPAVVYSLYSASEIDCLTQNTLRIVGKPCLSDQFKKVMKRYKSGIQHGYRATVCIPACKLNHSL